MRPTRRFGIALVAVLGGIAMSWQFGPRALNGIVAPLAGVSIIAAMLVYRTASPTIEREGIEPGFVGDVRPVRARLTVDGPASATVADSVGAGLESLEDRTTAIDDAGTFQHRVRLVQRGVHSVGPTAASVRDVFGLLERRETVRDTADVVVFPRPATIAPPLLTRLDAMASRHHTADRDEFDYLRSLAPGESMDRVNWKATAKRPDREPVVSVYRSRTGPAAVTVSGSCGAEQADELASVLAGIVIHLLETHPTVDVGLCLPGDTITPGRGDDHRIAVLHCLARLDGGQAGTGGDVAVRMTDDGETVEIDGEEIGLEGMYD